MTSTVFIDYFTPPSLSPILQIFLLKAMYYTVVVHNFDLQEKAT